MFGSQASQANSGRIEDPASWEAPGRAAAKVASRPARPAEGFPDRCGRHRISARQRPTHPAAGARHLRCRHHPADGHPGAVCGDRPGRRRSPGTARHQRAGRAARHRPGCRRASEPDRNRQIRRFSAAADRAAQDSERRGNRRRRDRHLAAAGKIPQPPRHFPPRPDLRHRDHVRLQQSAARRPTMPMRSPKHSSRTRARSAPPRPTTPPAGSTAASRR